MSKQEVLALLQQYYDDTRALYLACEVEIEKHKLFGQLIGYKSSIILVNVIETT